MFGPPSSESRPKPGTVPLTAEVHNHFVVFRKAVTGSQIAVNNGTVHQHQVIQQVVQQVVVTELITLPQVRAMMGAVRRVGVKPEKLREVRQAAHAFHHEVTSPVPRPDRLREAATRLVAVVVEALDTVEGERSAQAEELADVLRPALPTATPAPDAPHAPEEEGGLRG
ncbi:hypothetical protein [Streptomyces gottesmaniae]|uniref:hypothetical protein n=1 Tax=Streptomyces gottesmaniae TaxID=3075518 RepID=UPI00052E69A5|nr:hypothetical protein [Streptomyces sp. DSM 3412]